jgi:hypothetical protein
MSLTREELREELAALPTRDELRRDYPNRADLEAVLDTLATKEALERFATKENLERFATKEDLERFATKEDLERFATKEDLERFATKEDLKRFATKVELAELRHTMERGFTDLHRYMQILIEDLKAWTRTQFEVTNARLDAITSSFTVKDHEHDRRLDSLDMRVTRLESRPRRTPK